MKNSRKFNWMTADSQDETTMTAAKKAKEMGKWTHEAETRFVEMWQQYPVLYDVTSKDYHDRVKKEKCWQEIAVDLELPVAELQLKAASSTDPITEKIPKYQKQMMTKCQRPWRRTMRTKKVRMRYPAPSEPSTNPTLPLVVQEQSSRGTARNKARATKGKACDLEAEKVEILRAVSQTMLGTRQDVGGIRSAKDSKYDTKRVCIHHCIIVIAQPFVDSCCYDNMRRDRCCRDAAEKGSKLDVAAAASKRPVKQKSSVTDAATNHDSQQQSSS
ncbi:hypothetical protein N1851_026071 [Merluccius polli]|uniref:MADF domain-containing protein n=1 Tax=Merluccius polli TaxID=89951 RepID=A0AA47MCQ0_MERPO|nr:hypothetical protein N1851_026071 [Merluccius polli]